MTRNSFLNTYKRLNTGLECKPDRFYFPYFEKSVNNLTTLRTQLIPQLKPGDMLMVSDLAQLGNSVSDVLHIILPLLKNNIRINISNIGMIDNTDRGYWITKTLLAVARQEKDIRRFQLVQKAKDDKRKNKGGRPRRTLTSKYKAALTYMKTHTYQETVNKFHVSKSTLKRKKQFGVSIKN